MIRELSQILFAMHLSTHNLQEVKANCSACSVQLKRPMVNTPIDKQELADVLLAGHIKHFGKVPSASRLAMGWAQVALENGAGKYSYNHNLGNIGPSSPDQHWYFSRIDHNFYEDFDTFDEAAVVYWKTVGHCRGVVQRFDWGGGIVAAKMLKSCGYFGADLKAYSDNMASLYWTGLPYARAAIDKWLLSQWHPFALENKNVQ